MDLPIANNTDSDVNKMEVNNVRANNVETNNVKVTVPPPNGQKDCAVNGFVSGDAAINWRHDFRLMVRDG